MGTWRHRSQIVSGAKPDLVWALISSGSRATSCRFGAALYVCPADNFCRGRGVSGINPLSSALVLDNRRVSPTAINLWVRSIAAPPIRRDSPGGLMLPLSVDMSRGRRRGGLSIRGTGGLRRLIVGSFLIIFDGLPLRGIRTGEAQRGLKSIL